jgi:hypothetical protein
VLAWLPELGRSPAGRPVDAGARTFWTHSPSTESAPSRRVPPAPPAGSEPGSALQLAPMSCCGRTSGGGATRGRRWRRLWTSVVVSLQRQELSPDGDSDPRKKQREPAVLPADRFIRLGYTRPTLKVPANRRRRRRDPSGRQRVRARRRGGAVERLAARHTPNPLAVEFGWTSFGDPHREDAYGPREWRVRGWWAGLDERCGRLVVPVAQAAAARATS